MNKVKFEKIDWLCAAIATVLSFALYAWTVAPNVTLQDSGEFATAAMHFGVPHPTGYPLWTLLTWIFLRLPLGNAAWQAALFSGVCAALSIGLSALISSHAIRWLFPQAGRDASTAISLSFALLLACSLSMWSQAVIIEVYALHALTIGLFMLSLYRFVHDPASDSNIIISFFFLALAFSNHHLTLAMVPLPFLAVLLLRREIIWDMILLSALTGSLFLMGFAALSNEIPLQKTALRFTWSCLVALGVLVWLRRGRVEWKLLSFLPIVIAVGLLPYLYMPVASSTNPPMNWGYTRDKDGFYYSLNRSQYSGQLSALIQKTLGRLTGTMQEEVQPKPAVNTQGNPLQLSTGAKAQQWLGYFWFQLNRNFTPLCIFAFFGAFFSILRLDLPGRCWVYTLNIAFVLAAFLEPLMEDAEISNDGWWLQMPYHTYTYWIFSLLCATGTAFLWLKISERLPKFRPAIWLLLILPLWPLIINYSQCSQRNRWYGWKFGHDMLRDMPKGSVVYGGTDPGRFVPTYMIFGESGQPAKFKRDPYFDRRDLYIITQNAIGDYYYQKYIADHYGKDRPVAKNAFERWLGRENQYPASPLELPTHKDVEEMAKSMMQEMAKKNPGRPIEVASLQNNAGAKWIFEHNKKDHTFFVEESFPMEWSYPYAIPDGLVYRLNPEPLEALPPEVVKKDFDFWDKYIRDLTSDPDYYRDYDAERSFSKLRNTMGHIYSYRKMYKEAEKAYRQALLLWPENPETILSLSSILWEHGIYDEPLQLFEKALEFDPNNLNLFQIAGAAIRRKKLHSEITASEAALSRNPKDREAFKQLLNDYCLINDTNHLTTLLQEGKTNFNGDSEILECLTQYYFQKNNQPMARQTIEQLTRVAPKDPRHWFELSRIAAHEGDTKTAIDAAQKAIAEGGLNFREMIQNDPAYENLRNTNSQFQNILGVPLKVEQPPR